MTNTSGLPEEKILNSEIEGFVPVIIGITGHRDISEDQYGVLQQKVEEIIDNLKNKVPQTPLLLMTGLAEGGDMIGARAALKCGIAYIAVLPMPPEDTFRILQRPVRGKNSMSFC